MVPWVPGVCACSSGWRLPRLELDDARRMRIEPEIKCQLAGPRRLQRSHDRAEGRALLQLAGDLAQGGEIGEAEEPLVLGDARGFTSPHFSR